MASKCKHCGLAGGDHKKNCETLKKGWSDPRPKYGQRSHDGQEWGMIQCHRCHAYDGHHKPRCLYYRKPPRK